MNQSPSPAAGPTPDDLKRFRANLQGEIDGAALYRTMVDAESNASLKEFYRRLAETETRHGAPDRAVAGLRLGESPVELLERGVRFGVDHRSVQRGAVDLALEVGSKTLEIVRGGPGGRRGRLVHSCSLLRRPGAA